MRTRNSLAVFAAVFMVAGLAGCGDTESNDESPQNDGATTTTTPGTTTSSTAATTTTEPPTTTTERPTSTTTTQPSLGAWSVDGATFVAGQCFAAEGSSSGPLGSQAGQIAAGSVSISTNVAQPTESVPCDGPHAGEVMATGPACPVGSIGDRIDLTYLTKDIDVGAVAEVAAEYLGVDLTDLGGWLAERDLVLRFRRQVGDDMKITDTRCVLGAANGELTRPYRATG